MVGPDSTIQYATSKGPTSMLLTKYVRNSLSRLARRSTYWKGKRQVPTLLADARKPTRDHDQRAVDVVPTAFAYRKPPARERGKEVVRLCETPMLRGSVQIVRKSVRECLHSHTGLDGFWFVLRGRVRFYGPGDVTLGEFGPHEGILIPSATQYGFECVTAEDAELLQVLAYDRNGPVKRKNHAPREYDRSEVRFFDARQPSEDADEVPTADGS